MFQVPRIDGKIFFNANIIPEAMRESQEELLSHREPCLDWDDWKKWMRNAASGLLNLHELGLAHGDVTPFNLVVTDDGDAVWIDLENLNFDQGQRDKDTVSFLVYVLLFSYEMLTAVPPGLIDRLGEALETVHSGDELLERVFTLLGTSEKPHPSTMEANQSAVFKLVHVLTTSVTDRNCSWPATFTEQLFRGAVYFQKDFLWLVNFNMKIMLREKDEASQFLEHVNQLSERVETTGRTVESLTMVLSESNRITEDLEKGRTRLMSLSDKANQAQSENLELCKKLDEARNAHLREVRNSLQLQERFSEEKDCFIRERGKLAAELAQTQTAWERGNAQFHAELDRTQDENTKLRAQLETEKAHWSNERNDLQQRCDRILHEKEDLFQERNALGEKLKSLSDRMMENEREMVALRRNVCQSSCDQRKLRQLFDTVRQMLRSTSENSSFRIAKMLQIMRNPKSVGFSGRFAAGARLFLSTCGGKPFCQDYLALSNVLNRIDDGLREIKALPRNESEQMAPPDESVLISIVLPVYNQTDMLADSITSVVLQSYRNWELIIVNDGSTEDVYSVVKPFLTDRRIHYLEQSNQKLPKALSNGFDFANGGFLTWTSADNNMRPEMLTRLSAFLRRHPDTAMVYADYAVIDDRGLPFRAEWFRPQNKLAPDDSELHLPRSAETLNVVKDNFIGASFMYRRSVLGIIGDYDPQLGVEDYDYWMRINSLLGLSHLGSDEILYDYRVHHNSLNGKAAEFKILEKSHQLMEYEKKRAVFYGRHFLIYGSYQPSDLSLGRFQAEFVSGDPKEQAGETHKNILLVKGRELYRYSAEDLKKYDFVGAFFDLNEENDVGRNATLIRRNHISCFSVPGSAAAGRLAVFTADSVECSPAEFGRLALAAANNRLYFEKTRRPEEYRRELPRPVETRPRKVLILLERIGTGGMEQVAVDMANTFAGNGIRVQLCCVKDFVLDMKLPGNIEFHQLDKNDPVGDFRRMLADGVNDVIAHYTVWGAQAAAEAGVPFFQVLHNTYVWFGEEERRRYLEADAWTSAYIAVSANVAWYAMERMKLPPEKMLVIENGISFAKFVFSESIRDRMRRELGFSPEMFVLLNPASCYGVKGQLNLVHAFAAAYGNNPNLRLILAGKVLEESYAVKVREVIAGHHLENVVVMDRYFQDMPALYCASDAVVLPSFWEGCSLAAAEAVQMRRPLLAARVGDMERQTGGSNCVLYDLPFQYLTELTDKNYSRLIYHPNDKIIDSLSRGITDLASGNYPKSNHWGIDKDRSAEEAYLRYLRMFDYFSIGFSPAAIRHHI